MKLYRYYDSDGALLYIGISHNPLTRLSTHQFERLWSGEVRTITLEYFDNDDDARIAERRAIIAEDPPYNRAKPRGVHGKERSLIAWKLRRMNLADLEAASGVSRSTLWGIRQSRISPDPDTADAIWSGLEALDEADREAP